jgi:hypothetical protein
MFRFLCLIALIAFQLSARVLYVSPNGSDSNDGLSKEKPFKTLSFAMCGGTYLCPCETKNTNLLKAGDTLMLRGGTYDVSSEILTRPLTFANTGDSLNPIVVKNFPGEIPIIDGNYKNSIFSVGAASTNSNIIFDSLHITRGKRAGIVIGDRGMCHNITIRNCTITDILANDNTGCVYLSNGWDNVIIQNCYLNCGVSNGAGIISFKGENNCKIINNTIEGSIYGIYFKHAADDASKSTLNHNIVSGNVIKNNRLVGMHVTADRVIIKNNRFENNGNCAIGIFLGIGSSCNYAHADSCVIDSNIITGSGIVLGDPRECKEKGARYTSITNNIIDSKNYMSLAIWEYTDNPDSMGHKTYLNQNQFFSTASKPFCEYHKYYDFKGFKVKLKLDSNTTFNNSVLYKNYFGTTGVNDMQDVKMHSEKTKTVFLKKYSGKTNLLLRNDNSISRISIYNLQGKAIYSMIPSEKQRNEHISIGDFKHSDNKYLIKLQYKDKTSHTLLGIALD